MDCKEIQSVHSEGDQPWDFFGGNDAKAETPVLRPSHAKSWLIGKDSDDGRDWGQEEKGKTEDTMAGWHHWLDGHEFEWTLGVGDGQGGLACCDSWGHKQSDTIERLNWTELNWCIWLWNALKARLKLYSTILKISQVTYYSKVLMTAICLSICQQFWKTQQWPQDWKRSVLIPIPKKGNTK